MRAGLSTIQQTLTPEAATVLNHSIAEAGRRNHGQTTPLHVAATLLSSPSGFLRQACIRSHPNSSHPLQCRALELCFSVALERLPTAHNTSPAMEPPISNALMAALKRAQAHQRRGCPEQQQQPLLAVKVELEQLIISILDDPSVSRVMREASFSSPAVKATIEQSMNSPPATSVNPSIVGLGFRPSPTPMAMPNRNLPVKSTIEQSLNSQATSVNQSSKVGPGFRPTPTPMVMPNRNLYLNPRLQQGNSVQSGQQMNEEVKRVIDILLRTKKRNPVLVGDSEPEAVIKELLRRIEKGEFGGGPLENVQVIPLEKELSLDKTQIPTKLKELGGVIESRIGNSNGGGVILDLGDLKWLVEQPVSLGVPGGGGLGQQVVSERGRAAVAEMGKLVMEGSNGRIWLIGTATCETYLRCQVYHPSMENDWDLQAVPIASKSPLPGMFPRLGTNGIISSSVGSLIPLKSFPTATTALPRRVSENSDPARRMGCCPQCTENYQKELAKLSEDSDKSSSEVKSDSSQPSLPQWLRDAKLHNSDVKSTDQLKTKDEEMIFKQKSQELHKKWSDTCMNIHPNFHRNLSSSERTTPTALSMTGLYNPNLLLCQNFNPTKLQQTKNIGLSLQLNPNSGANQPGSPPRSPVRTELVLGQTKISETSPEKTHEERVKDLPGCISSEPQTKFNEWKIEKFANSLDADEFKQLLKGLMEKVWWQKEAVSAVATSITRCKLGNGKQRAAGTKGDIWLLFTGPDRVGKKKMASVLSEQAGGGNPVIICLGSRRDDEESDFHFRGKTVLDRIAEAVRRNPFSVIMLQDIDEANMLVRGSIKRAMERGRLADSHGREISLGNIIFILTANSDDLNTTSGNLLDENKLASVASGGWQLRLSLSGKSAKRRANWLFDEDRATRPRKELGSGLSFDLNEVADTDDHKTDGSHDSSDLTVDHEDELDLENRQFAITSVPHELATFLDDAIIFNPVQIRAIRREIKNAITKKFFSILDDKLTIEVQDEALEKIVGGVWLGQTSLEDWAEKVLVPSFNQLKSCLSATILTSSCENMVIRLEPDNDSETRNSGDWLPSKITVMVNGV